LLKYETALEVVSNPEPTQKIVIGLTDGVIVGVFVKVGVMVGVILGVGVGLLVMEGGVELGDGEGGGVVPCE
jgi:hypothetical protein